MWYAAGTNSNQQTNAHTYCLTTSSVTALPCHLPLKGKA